MDDRTYITQMIEQYLEGLYRGDTEMLNVLFSAECVLKTPGVRRTMTAWLQDVATRSKPKDIGHSRQEGVIALDIEGDQAMAKVECSLPSGHFLDYLGFLREESGWKIVNKMYALKP
ncbi:nuclear transport factor 2 family protein [Pseudomaricurvus alkylphenolicus]|jgi:hypothetical protein|uniref:nuclear transport factor 2 family protein n=1 Tax=Pseudomaricurvus alkylphenolicus TaxID=1306991 RepID=UPI00142053CB|nr:nuclear transport factor 2 family protein [Pseudomaricurvus alkylphenolicus]NIB40764.1 nuclear transport factor 2 family protein [Pseudomaricurvus alkylphenolicus]